MGAMWCSGKDHATKKRTTVVMHFAADGCDRHGTVVSEGFDLHGKHMGYVGFEVRDGLPARLVFRELCSLKDGDPALAQGDPNVRYLLDVDTNKLRVIRTDTPRTRPIGQSRLSDAAGE